MSSHSKAFSKLHGAMALGAVVLATAAPVVNAAIVVVTPAVPISIPNNIDGIYFNVVTGIGGPSSLDAPGWDINPYNNNAGLTFYGNAAPYGILATGTPGTTAVTVVLNQGDMITSTGQYNQFQTRGTGFQTPGLRFMGFKFLNETTNATNYGWLLISSGATAGFPAAIAAYGYGNAGEDIAAGAGLAPIPEPGTYAMMALGLAAVGGFVARRRKQDQAA